jgi:AmmeMemoRadiSam system protein B
MEGSIVEGSIVFAGIAPHPPLLVPEVGGGRIATVANSQRALREFSSRLIDNRPDTVVVISPHSPMGADMFLARSTETLRGDFREFGTPSVSLSFKNDLDLLAEIKRAAAVEGAPVDFLRREYELDHGALVPLYYLHERGWSGPVVVFGFTMLSNELHLRFGRSISAAARATNKRLALVASGDLSHRLIVGGPYQFEPTAHLFDEQVVDAVASGEAERILNIDSDLRDRAGECGYRSIVIALGSVNQRLTEHRVLSYEGPFGVGYMVALLADSGGSSTSL